MSAAGFQIWKGEKIRFSIQLEGGAESVGAAHNVVATYYSYFPLVARASSPYEPDDNPCQATTTSPGASYMAWPDDQYDFYKLVVPITSKVTLTVTNFTALGQLQFRSPLIIGSDCSSPTDSTTRIDPFWASNPPNETSTAQVYFNIAPGIYYARLSTSSGTNTTPYTFRWNYAQGTSPYEPNQTACDAAAISVNTPYYAYPDDANDFYSFDLATTSNVQITVTNYTATGQYLLYKQNAGGCGDLTTVTYKPSGSGTVTLSASNLTAGRYYFRVATISGANATALYSFRVATSLGTWNPRLDLCAAFSGCSDHASNSSVTVYWDNAPGATTMRIYFEKTAIGTCSAGTSAIDETFTPSQPSGSRTYNSLATGSYAVKIWIWNASSQEKFDSKPLKVNCDTLLTERSSGSLEASSTVTATIGPVVPLPEPTVTPIPLPMDLPSTRPTPEP